MARARCSAAYSAGADAVRVATKCTRRGFCTSRHFAASERGQVEQGRSGRGSEAAAEAKSFETRINGTKKFFFFPESTARG